MVLKPTTNMVKRMGLTELERRQDKKTHSTKMMMICPNQMQKEERK